MSHEHNEIVIPPTDNVAEAIRQVLAPYNENSEDEDRSRRSAFWDFYVIGGRWSGAKLQASLDPVKIEHFYAWLKESKVTVSGLQFGKQELDPSSQIPMVDAKWQEMFPGTSKSCPMFQHSGQRPEDPLIVDDVCRLDKVSSRMEIDRFILAGPQWVNDGRKAGNPLEATYMVQTHVFIGPTYHSMPWDGTFGQALEMSMAELQRYSEEYAELLTPKEDWLVVTVDTHS